MQREGTFMVWALALAQCNNLAARYEGRNLRRADSVACFDEPSTVDSRPYLGNIGARTFPHADSVVGKNCMRGHEAELAQKRKAPNGIDRALSATEGRTVSSCTGNRYLFFPFSSGLGSEGSKNNGSGSGSVPVRYPYIYIYKSL